MEHREAIALVTGASSEIGNACATYLAKKGLKTYGSFREPSRYEKKADEFFELLELDELDESSTVRAAESLLGKEGHIDQLVCCVESGAAGTIAESTIDDARLRMDSEYLGTLSIIKAFLPSMRDAGSGRIIIVSSLFENLGLPFGKRCSAAARALEGLAESLRRETSAYGVAVCHLQIGRRKQEHEGRAEAFAAAKVAHALLCGHHMPARRFVACPALRLAAIGKRFLPTISFEALMRLFGSNAHS
jgi:NAD(P)-dependent dehydrogenase (short-subunit alcohol dehydrogenase family)